MVVGKVTDSQSVRFESFVMRTDGCWHWIGHLRSGYGRLMVNGSFISAHRMSYEHFVGPIPDGLEIDHLCRNRSCVNPDHLEPVTRTENIRRGTSPAARNAVKSHCPRGHEFSGENLLLRNRKNHVGRVCRACNIEACKAFRERARQRAS